MNYEDYLTHIEYSDEDARFIGHIAGFHGKSVDELRTAFKEAVDDYLATCEKFK